MMRRAIGDFGFRIGAEYRAQDLYIHNISPTTESARNVSWIEHRLRVDAVADYLLTLASGADRRVTGVYALLQSLLPLLAYAGALWLPVLIHGNRRAMPGPA